MNIFREAKAISHAELRIRSIRKKPFSSKYVVRLIRGDQRAKIVLNKAAAEKLIPILDHHDLLGKRNASMIMAVLDKAEGLKKDVQKRMEKAANDDDFDQQKAA